MAIRAILAIETARLADDREIAAAERRQAVQAKQRGLDLEALFTTKISQIEALVRDWLQKIADAEAAGTVFPLVARLAIKAGLSILGIFTVQNPDAKPSVEEWGAVSKGPPKAPLPLPPLPKNRGRD